MSLGNLKVSFILPLPPAKSIDRVAIRPIVTQSTTCDFLIKLATW